MSDIKRRADLEAQAVSFPEYITDRVFPYISKNQIAGTFYYQQYQSDIAAQYNRAHASLSSISETVMASASTTFSCVEVRSRIKMGYAEQKGYSDLANAELAMGRRAKRAFYNKIEALCADKLLNVDSPIDATSAIVGTIDTNVSLLRDKGIGRIGLVLSNHNFVALKADDTVKARMQNTGVALTGLDPRFIAPTQIAAIFGVDEVIIGKDDIWYTGLGNADKGNVALCILPEKAAEPQEEVQLGRTIYFDWESAAEHFIMESWHDDVVDANVVDAKGLVDMKLLNTDLVKVIKIAAAPSSSSSASSL